MLDLQKEKAVNIAEFLLARIAEDEAVVTLMLSDPDMYNEWRNPASAVIEVGRGLDNLIATNDKYLMEHIARHDPARVLAECAAKRAIIEIADDADNYGTCAQLQFALASVYADHADYQQEWALDTP